MRLHVLALWEWSIAMEVMPQVRAPPLHQVSGKSAPVRGLVGSAQIIGKILELRIQQCEERAKGSFISAVGSGGNEDQVAIGFFRQLRKEFVATMCGSPAFR